MKYLICFRDWQGLATLAKISPREIPVIRNKTSPTEEVFKIWKENSIGLLLDYLEKMERYDILDDIEEEKTLGIYTIKFFLPIYQIC